MELTEQAAVTLDDVVRAAERIRGVAVETPLVRSFALGARFGANVYLKAENLQRTGSFKFRGAYNAISSLALGDRARGVITYSSGNHGQAVAAAAQLLDVRAVVVMPENAIATKVEGVRRYGARAEFAGTTSTAREEAAKELAAREGYVVIPPFDDPRIIAGQGTAGTETVRQGPELDVVLVPVGGGGLSSGVATAVKGMSTRTQVLGVEPVGAADAHDSLARGAPVTWPKVDTIADGLRTNRIGDLNYGVLSRLLDGIVLVEEDDIRAAVRALTVEAKLTVEPSGAVGVAALLGGKVDVRGRTVGVVLSGGNVDPAFLAALLSS